MKDLSGSLLGRVALRFDPEHQAVPHDLSAALRTSTGALLVAGDELASLQLLQPSATCSHVYAEHRSFPLHEALGLAPDEEVDVEGVTCIEDGSAMFLIGSHSAKRKKPRGKSDKEDLERLATVKVEPARELLARIPLHEGEPVLADTNNPVALMKADDDRSLLGLLADDAHLGPFVARGSELTIPGKDNGFDIEGLAFFAGRLLVGLRGPVLRGWAFVLDFAVDVNGEELAFAGKKQSYRKHALDLDGLGVRELITCGDDVLVLAGPTMALDGAHRMFRWRGGPSAKKDSVVAQGKGQLEHMFDLPFQRGFDRAEGVALSSWFREDDSLLVVYDAPGDARRLDENTVLADVFAL
jgi:hypothetical protein